MGNKNREKLPHHIATKVAGWWASQLRHCGPSEQEAFTAHLRDSLKEQGMPIDHSFRSPRTCVLSTLPTFQSEQLREAEEATGQQIGGTLPTAKMRLHVHEGRGPLKRKRFELFAQMYGAEMEQVPL